MMITLLFGRAAYKDLGGRFPALILDDQECFKSKEQWETLLALIPDQGLPPVSTSSTHAPSLTTCVPFDRDCHGHAQRLDSSPAWNVSTTMEPTVRDDQSPRPQEGTASVRAARDGLEGSRVTVHVPQVGCRRQ